MTQILDVEGHCPACGERKLHRMGGGLLQCLNPLCAYPGAAQAMLADGVDWRTAISRLVLWLDRKGIPWHEAIPSHTREYGMILKATTEMKAEHQYCRDVGGCSEQCPWNPYPR